MPSTTSLTDTLIKELSLMGLKNAASHILPVADVSVLKLLGGRAASFLYRSQGVPCFIIPEFALEIVPSALNHHVFLAMVDLRRSSDLVRLVSGLLGYEATADNSVALLVVERRFDAQMSQRVGRPVISHRDAILLGQVENDFGIRATHLLTPSWFGTTALYPDRKETTRDNEANRKRLGEIDRIIPPASKGARGFGTQIVAWDGEHWGTAEFFEKGNIVLRTVGQHQIQQLATEAVVSLGDLRNFRPTSVEAVLAAGLEHQYEKYDDARSSLVIPGLSNVISPIAAQIDFASGPGPYFLPASGGDLSF
jgi:hypothetical protein